MTHFIPRGDDGKPLPQHDKDAKGRERFPGLPTSSKRKNQSMNRSRKRRENKEGGEVSLTTHA